MTSIFSIYHTKMFYLVQIVFIFLVSIFVNIAFFVYSVFNDIFYVNNITNIFDNNLYITQGFMQLIPHTSIRCEKLNP